LHENNNPNTIEGERFPFQYIGWKKSQKSLSILKYADVKGRVSRTMIKRARLITDARPQFVVNKLFRSALSKQPKDNNKNQYRGDQSSTKFISSTTCNQSAK